MIDDGWLAKIEALKKGDVCEVQCNELGIWVPGVVEENDDLAGLWKIRVKKDGESVWYRYIEQVRRPGQTEAWPRFL